MFRYFFAVLPIYILCVSANEVSHNWTFFSPNAEVGDISKDTMQERGEIEWKKTITDSTKGATEGFIIDFKKGGSLITDNISIPPVNYSISFWIKLNALPVADAFIVADKRGSTAQFLISIGTYSKQGFLSFNVWSGKNVITLSSSERLQLSKWIHFTITVDEENRITMYKDGVRDGEVKAEFQPAGSTGKISFGKDLAAHNTGNFAGQLFDMRVYNDYILRSEDISEIINEKKPPRDVTPLDDIGKISVKNVMGFEDAQAWVTAPIDAYNEFLADNFTTDGMTKELLGKVKSVRFDELSGGAQLSGKNVKQGKYSLCWKDHEYFPTLATFRLEMDWSKYKSISVWIFSEKATGQTVIIAPCADNPATAWRDYYMYPLTIDFTGWKEVCIPLSYFAKFETPGGWDTVSGLYFFTKALGLQPNPYTVIYLDDMKLIQEEKATVPKQTLPDPYTENMHGFVYKRRNPVLGQDIRNHLWPELLDNKNVQTEIVHQYFFRGVRALYKYFPRYQPGYVSFDHKGKAYINIGDYIQYKDEKGMWVVSDIKTPLIKWAKEKGWKGLYNHWGDSGPEQMVRFDSDLDAYSIQLVEEINEKGEIADWKTRTGLLLHSRDKLKTWDVYVLPFPRATFEKIDGHNQTAIQRPPLLLNGAIKYFDGADQSGYLIIPEKKSDGTLSLSKTVRYSPNCLMVGYHSGDGNLLITGKDLVYIAYGWYPPQDKVKEYLRPYAEYNAAGNLGKPLIKWDWDRKNATANEGMPPIPENHAGLKQEYFRQGKFPAYSRTGLPSFVVTYNLKTGVLSSPVYVGSGGFGLDDHNWPAISIDGKGYLHVILNGHHDPLNYIRSSEPYEISAWKNPEHIIVDEKWTGLSYGTLICDRNNNLYTANRSTTGVYNFHLSMNRMNGQTGKWEKERPLITPFKYMYRLWYQKMSIDVTTDRIFISYYDQCRTSQISRTAYDFYVFTWPDIEKRMCKAFGKANVPDNGPPDPGKINTYYDMDASEMVILVSSDQGKTFRLARNEDF